MSRKRRYVPEEPASPRAAKATKISSEQQALRHQAATLRVHANWTIPAIMKHLDVGESFVKRWSQRLREGDFDLYDSPRAGRPVTATSPAIQRKVMSAHRNKRFKSTRKTAIKLGISQYSVRSCLKNAGLVSKRVQKAPKFSEKNIADRLRFCRKHKRTNWNKIMFTDEKDFWLFSKPHGKNDQSWVGPDDPVPTAPQMKYSPKVKVWGGITTHGKTRLVVYEGSLSAAKYQQLILKPALRDIKRLLPDCSHVFQQDGATCHTAKSTQEFLAKQSFTYLPKEDWPGNSPDLNPIENLWAKLAWQVAKRQPKDVAELTRFLKQEWAKFDDDFVASYIKSMPRRIKAVEKSKGQFTKY